MNPTKGISSWLILFLLIISLAKPVSAQSSEQFSEISVEEEYSAGLTAFDNRNWPRAIVAFEKVLQVDRNHREARLKFNKARRYLEQECLNTVLADYYAEGVAALQNNDVQAAYAALSKVCSIDPRYRDAASLLAKIEAPRGDKTEQASSTQLDSLYQLAVSLSAKENWREAAMVLEKLHRLHPGYRDGVDLLVQARVNLKMAENVAAKAAPRSTSASSSFFSSGALVALFVVPLIGFVLFSPTMQARYCLFCNNYAGAARIYEKLLARRPSRTKLYTLLAKTYLLMGRRDEPALKVYKMILQLNLPVANREEINAIVTQKYLTEGRMDYDAIEVFEEALKAERHKQNHT